MTIPKINLHSPPARELRFALAFLLTFCVLQYVYLSCRSDIVEHLVIDVATVRPSAALINWIDSSRQALASGHSIRSPHGSISVLNGCEGTETLFLLISAIAAFCAPWLNKLRGIVLGTLLVYCLNQARIVALFFAAQDKRDWFDMIHGYVAPSLIIALSSLFFLWWAHTAIHDESTHAA